MAVHRWKGVFYATLAASLLSACSEGSITASAYSPQTVAPEYLIGPGDSLNVFVYRAPELSATGLPVRPDGRLSLPLAPDLEAAGRTPTQLSRSIEERLRKYVRDPIVTVMVQSFVGQPNQQVRVIGEAAQPLAVPYREGMTVLDAMIAAHGLTRFAAGNRARLLRLGKDGTPRETVPVRLADLLRDGDLTQDVPLRPGDTLVIPMAWF